MLKRALFVICAAMALAAPSGTMAQENVTVDKIVAVVGTSGISYSEVYEVSDQLRKYGRRIGYTGERNPMSQAMETLLERKLLFQQALVDSIKINEGAITEIVNDQVEEMVAEAGSMSELEKQYGQQIFEIREDLRVQYEENQYADGMRTSILEKVTITPGEVERYYKNTPEDKLPIVPDQYVFAQIVRYPATKAEARIKARENLLGMKERITSGETSFEIMARMYSKDTESARRGGEIEPMPKQQFDPAVAGAIENLRPGQLSDVVESQYGFELLQMIDKAGGNYHIRRIIITPEYSSQDLLDTDVFLDSLTNVIRMDSVTFAKAAQDNSEDKYSKMNGGLASNLEQIEKAGGSATYATTRHRIDDMVAADYLVLKDMKPGEISPAYSSRDMSGAPLSKVVKLIEVIPAHTANLNDDYAVIEAEALLEKKQAELNSWMTRKIASMYVKIDLAFHYDDFTNKAWFK